MSSGDHGAATLRRYSEAQARLEHAGGYDWRDRAASVVRGLGFTEDDLDRPLQTFSGGELTRASLARALASQPDLLLLDEPTNHLDIESLEWLEQMLKTLDAAVILVAHDRWFLEAVTTAVLEVEGGKSIYFPGAWHVWRREQAARAIHQTKTAARQAEQLERLERFVERFRYKASKAKQAQARVKQIKKLEANRVLCARRASPHPRLRVPEAGALGSRRARGRGSLAAGRRQAPARRRVDRDRARRARRARRPERLRQDDAARDAARPPRAEGRDDPARSRRRGGVLLTARGRARRTRLGARRGDVRHRPQAPGGAEAARALPLLRLGRAREAGRRAVGRRAQATRARDRRRVGRELPRARRADEPPRPRVARVARGGARGVSGHGAARLARPRAARRRRRPAARGRGPHDRVVSGRLGRLRPCAGGRRDRRAPPPPKQPKVEKPKRPAKPKRSPIELVEAEVARAEERVAQLERQLADDWGDTALVAAHRDAREDLAALLSRWEALFEASGSPAP